LSFGTAAVISAVRTRSPEVDRSKGHVLLVGDSVVWGYGERHDLQALNLGVSWYGIDQYYLWLKRKLDEIPSAWQLPKWRRRFLARHNGMREE
jgi:hypothetical protein